MKQGHTRPEIGRKYPVHDDDLSSIGFGRVGAGVHCHRPVFSLFGNRSNE
jgi:hypothetical protein